MREVCRYIVVRGCLGGRNGRRNGRGGHRNECVDEELLIDVVDYLE